MSANKIDLDAWLDKNVNWMIQETSHYFETRELLALCQTVATMRLARVMEGRAGGAPEGVGQAILEMGQRQNQLLERLLAELAAQPGQAKTGVKE
ncbi:MAG: hypothetical protein LDL07_07115 [Desulfarculus sp.]|nr:hypothetical protein [Desulfarculus sp.]